MTAETLKPFIKVPIEAPVVREKRGNKALVYHSIVLAIFYAGLLGFVIWNSVRVANLQKEVKYLNMLVDSMQKRLGFDLLDDLDEFEEAYGNPVSADNVIPNKKWYEINDNDDDYDTDLDSMEGADDHDDGVYEDDDLVYGTSSEEEDLSVALNDTYRDSLEDSLYDELDSIDDEDAYSKSEKTTKADSADSERKARSISSRSGVPVIEQPYLPKINKSDASSDVVEPTLKYDWKEKREQYLERKHKKYMESRSKPTSIIRKRVHHDDRNEGAANRDAKQVVLSPEVNSLEKMMQYEKLPYGFAESRNFGSIINIGNFGSANHKERFEHGRWNDYIAITTVPTMMVKIRPNRVMHSVADLSEAHRQDKAASSPAQVVLTGTRRRAIRPMHKSLEGRGRQRTVAVHYVGDTSRYIPGHHKHYEGNGRLKHSGGVYSDWIVDPAIGNVDQHFHMENGVVTINDNGIYLLYAQIFYHDDHDTNGFRIERNGVPFLMCTSMTHSIDRVTKSNTCFTSGVTPLRTGDKIHISDLGYDRHVILDPIRSFFGLVKIGAAGTPHRRVLHHTDAEKFDTDEVIQRSSRVSEEVKF